MKRALRLLCLLLSAALVAFLLTGCSGLSAAGLLPTQPPADYASPPDGFRYAKSLLSPQEQYLCDQLLKGIRNHEVTIDDLYPDSDEILKAAQAIDTDYPELFWFSGGGNVALTSFSGQPVKASYQPVYTMAKTDCAQAQQAIDAWVAGCFASLPDGASDYQKVQHVYEYIIDHTDYGEVDSNSIVNVMVGGSGLCGCYAKTTQYLLNRLDIPCTYVTGTAKGDSHAWNLIWLDGESFWLDTTWGDPVFTGGDAIASCSYDYFCITTADLLRTHTLDGKLAVPDCTSEIYNYYRYNSLYFTSFDREALLSAIEKALSSGQETLSVRFSDDSYPTALRKLFREGAIYTLYRQAEKALSVKLSLSGSVWYSRDDDMGSIMLHLPY